MVNRGVVEVITRHMEGWLFGEEGASGVGGDGGESFFASLVFIKMLRLVEEHYQTPELVQLR